MTVDYHFLEDDTVTTLNKDANVSRMALKTNFLINIVSRPLILKYLNVHKYMQWYSALHLSRALSNRGIELPALAILPALVDAMEETNKNSTCNGTASADSGIFKSEVTTPKKTNISNALPKQDVTNAVDIGKISSIFDSFDAPPKAKLTPKITKSAVDMSSSIFDSFDAPPKEIPSKSTKSNGEYDCFYL